MAPPRGRYFYRAYFKPDQLGLLKELHSGFDSNGRGLGYAKTWHRTNWDFSPRCVANEFICAELGRYLRLPIPPSCISRVEDGVDIQVFSSLDFNCERATLPEILPDVVCAAMPHLSCGVITFDILIANNDRHNRNLLTNDVLKPSQLLVFDHDQALTGGEHGGIERLEDIQDRIGISGGTVSSGNRHCLLSEISTSIYFKEWTDRVQEIPDWVIEDICKTALSEKIINGALCKALIKFIKHRRDKIDRLIHGNRPQFESINDWKDYQWPLFP